MDDTQTVLDQTLRVLVVDYDFKTSISIKTALGWSTKIKAEGARLLASAIESVEKERPDVILLSLDLPDSKGIAALTAVKNVDPTIPVIILSRGNDEDLIIEAMLKGAQHYILPTQIDEACLRMAISYGVTRMSREAQLVRERSEAHQAEARLAATLDCMRDGLCQVDTQNRITYANPAALEILGYTPDTLLGCKLHDTLHYKYPSGEARPVETCPLWLAFRDGRPHHDADDYLVRKDGTLVWVEYSSAPVKLQGETIGGVICFRDNSELRVKSQHIDELVRTASTELRPSLEAFHDAIDAVDSQLQDPKFTKTRTAASTALSISERLMEVIRKFQ
jgi:PAS domain S-box-containing protein